MFAKLNHVAQSIFYKALFERTNLGDYCMSDLDGVLIAVSERPAA